DVDRAAGRGREAPARHERLDTARDLGVTQRVLLDVHARDRAGLRDRPVDDDLTGERGIALEGALVAGLDGAEARAHLLRDHGRIELAVDRRGLALHRAGDLLLGSRRARAAG